MSNPKNRNNSKNVSNTKNGAKSLGPLVIGSIIAATGLAVGVGITFAVLNKSGNQEQVDQLSSQVQALIELQEKQMASGGGDAAAAAKEAINAHFEAERESAKQKILAGAPAATDDVPSDKHLYGNPEARFTLIEYSDFECPFCARFHDTPKSIVEASEGNMNWEYRHFPLSSHDPAATDLAIASECVSEHLGNEAFWAFNMEVFRTSGGNGAGVPDLPGLVQTLGMSPQDLSACMQDPSTLAKVNEDLEDAASEGVSGTPSSYIIDNVTGDVEIIAGAQPTANVVQKLRSLTQRSRETEANGSEPNQ